jgi:hypothetical protein
MRKKIEAIYSNSERPEFFICKQAKKGKKEMVWKTLKWY